VIARLSEAILLGSTILKPSRYEAISKDGSSGCAVGMALVANGHARKRTIIGGVALTELYPWTKKAVSTAAPCHCGKALNRAGKWPARAIIMHLFDEHKWSAERIADYVAKIEPVPVEELTPAASPELTEALVAA
jgi:hypothetical protein